MSLAELKTTFPNSTADWRETQLEAGASLVDAALDYAGRLEAQIESARAAHAAELYRIRTEDSPPVETAAESMDTDVLDETEADSQLETL